MHIVAMVSPHTTLLSRTLPPKNDLEKEPPPRNGRNSHTPQKDRLTNSLNLAQVKLQIGGCKQIILRPNATITEGVVLC